MFDNWRKQPRKKKIKNILAISASVALSAAAICGIVIPSVDLSKNIYVQSDFSEGRTLQLNFKLVDQNNNFIQNEEVEQNVLKESASYLISLLENKGLSNIRVNYGLQVKETNLPVDTSSNAVNPNPFKSGDKNYERFGTLYASFDNNADVLGLKDVENQVNSFYNDSIVYNSFITSNRYSLEVLPSSDNFMNIKPNFRWTSTSQNKGHDGLYVQDIDGNFETDLKYKFAIINDKDNYDGEIQPYVDKDGNKSATNVEIKNKNLYNVGSFVNDLNSINEIKAAENEGNASSWSFDKSYINYLLSNNSALYETTSNGSEGSGSTDGGGNGEETPPEPSKPSPVEQFQTTATWILWNDKEGLINYLNTLIIAWYFNLYANIQFRYNANTNTTYCSSITQTEIQTMTKDNYNTYLFDTSKYNYANYVDTNTRNKINEYINTLSDIEKRFMAFCAIDNVGGYYGGDLWHPILINNDNLIPILYNFYNSRFGQGLLGQGDNNPDPNTSSISERNGWAWIESDATSNPVKDLLGNHLITFIDYRNFQDFFINPTPPNTSDENYKETDPINPYYINDIVLSNSNYTADEFSQILTSGFYEFPLINFNQQQFINEFPLFQNEFAKLGNEYNANINQDEYKQRCTALANKYINPDIMFSYQGLSRPTILDTFGGLSSLEMLFIIISCLIFLVGIFVSIRYRVPGIISFILIALTYVLSILFYSKFGYGFSFFTLLASSINAFLSFLVSFLFCKNVFKEIADNANIVGAIVTSIKKYWRLSLDINAVLILSSLAFLFFGEINNINIGAILIISSFLSFILSGVIYFILMLLYVITLDVTYEWLFMSKRKYKLLLKFANSYNQSKFALFINKLFINVNYFTKWSYISIIGLIVIMIVGTIVLFLINPISSIDFTSSNIIFINNFDKLGLSQIQIIDILGVNSFNNYVYDNTMVIYTTNNLNFNDLVNKVTNMPELLSNINVTYLSSEISMRLVMNTLKCAGIAIGFSAIWYLVSLNIVSVLPIAISQVLFALLFMGFAGVTRIPFDINSIAIMILMFLISSCVIIISVSQFKRNWKKHNVKTFSNFKQLILSTSSSLNKMQVLLYFFILLFGIISVILLSSSISFAFVLLIMLSVVCIFVNNLFIAVLWYWSNIIINKFTKEISSDRAHVKLDYDDVNEQPVLNLNC